MSVTIQAGKTKPFIKHSVKLSWIAFALVIIAILTSGRFSKQVANQRVTVSPNERVTLSPINLQRRLIGALRIDVKAIMPYNRWVVYEIQLYDDQNQLLASARKEAWRERGVWREGGETGTWSESDLLGGLDVQLGKKQQEEITIAVSVLEYGETGGKVLRAEPVSFQVDVKNGVIDRRYLWIGFLGTLVMAILTTLSVGRTNQEKIFNINVNHGHSSGRTITGGENNLIRVTAEVLSDETSPKLVSVNLCINNGMGEQIYNEKTDLKLNFNQSDQTIDNPKGKLEQYFVLMPRRSYEFYVEATPAEPIYETILIVQDQVNPLSGNKDVKLITVDDN